MPKVLPWLNMPLQIYSFSAQGSTFYHSFFQHDLAILAKISLRTGLQIFIFFVFNHFSRLDIRQYDKHKIYYF